MCKRVYWLLLNMYVCVCKHVMCVLFIVYKRTLSSVESNLWVFQICCVVSDLLCFFDVLESSLQFSRARLVEIMSLMRARCHLLCLPTHKCDDAVAHWLSLSSQWCFTLSKILTLFLVLYLILLFSLITKSLFINIYFINWNSSIISLPSEWLWHLFLSYHDSCIIRNSKKALTFYDWWFLHLPLLYWK